MKQISRFVVVFIVALLAPINVVWAQKFPERVVTFIVPFPAGTATDVVARIVAEDLTKKWGQSVIVENRPGAGGNIGSEFAARANADGYSVLWATVANSISTTLYDNLNYHLKDDFDAVTLIAKMPLVLITRKESQYETLSEMVEYAKTNKSSLAFASGGVGTSNHLAGEMLNALGGIDMTHVPYRGTPNAYADLVSGRVDIMFDNIVPAMAQIKTGQLKPLAVAGLERSFALPNVPSVNESGYPGFEAFSWLALVVPTGTPKEVIEKINEGTVEILNDPEVKERLALFGAEASPGTPDELAQFIDNEIKKWANVIKEAQISIN